MPLPNGITRKRPPRLRLRSNALLVELASGVLPMSGNDMPALRQEARRDLLAESRKHGATKLLCQVPCIGPIRAALLIALIQTPYRFRTKRQLWSDWRARSAAITLIVWKKGVGFDAKYLKTQAA